MKVHHVVFLGKPGYETAIPKPSTIRPIVLLSHLLKVYTTLRLPLMTQAMLQLPDCICGGKQGKTVTKEVAATALHLDMQRAMGYSPAGLHSDLSKAYEGIDHRILQHLLSSAGLPSVFIHMLLDAYAGPKW
eukprot:6454992-Amphidinium_carterae.1